MTPLILAALLSMSPVGELRVGIPVALASGVNPWLALVVCVFANFLVAPIVFAILELFHTKFLHVNSHQSSLDKFMERSRVKVNPWIEKYGVFLVLPYFLLFLFLVQVLTLAQLLLGFWV